MDAAFKHRSKILKDPEVENVNAKLILASFTTENTWLHNNIVALTQEGRISRYLTCICRSPIKTKMV